MDQGSAGALQLKWELSGHGWARCHLSDDSQTASVTASYCTDALADLVAGAGELYGQQRSARFFFDAEPQEFRWVLRTTDDAVNVTICKFPDVAVSPDLPDFHGTVMWQATYPRSAFAHAVLEAAHTVLTEHGEIRLSRRVGNASLPRRTRPGPPQAAHARRRLRPAPRPAVPVGARQAVPDSVSFNPVHRPTTTAAKRAPSMPGGP